MSRPPKCKLCGSRHWLAQPHVYPNVSRETKGAETDQIVSRETFEDVPLVQYDWAARERELGLPVNAPMGDR